MKSPLLEMNLLGCFRLIHAGTPIETITPRLQSFLAYLVLHRDAPQSRQHLAFLFWPDSTERQARANLRKLLHQLREALPMVEHFLHADAQTLHWQPDAPFRLDAAQFEAALAEVAPVGAPHAAPSPPVGALPGSQEMSFQAKARNTSLAAQRAALEKAVNLYQGDLLPACYDDWIHPERERLYQRFITALEQLLDLLEEQGDYRAALPYARRLAQTSPLRETAYRRLMRLHAQLGDRAAALETYRRCAQVLQRELGVEPGPAMKRLYERLAAPEAGQPTPHNLPPQPVSFVGREEELAAIAARLGDPSCRLLTLVGPGGVGKTRLALRAAHDAVTNPLLPFPHGITFIPLAALESHTLLAPAIAEALNFQFHGRRPPAQQLLDYLRDREALLILDNFEHLLDGVHLLAAILAGAPRVKLLVTSRERLQLQEEWLVDVTGLPLPTQPGTGDHEGRPSAAVELFHQRAQQLQPDFSPAEESACVLRICRLVEGLPLAIELAAVWLRSLTCHQIADQIEHNLDFLASSYRNVPERQRSIRAVFDHSWQLLSESERAAFRRLSVFPASFDRAAAAQVAGAPLAQLTALVEKSVLSQEGARYHRHELLRQYGREKLEAKPHEAARVLDRHRDYYAEYLCALAPELRGPEQKAALAAIGREIDNIRTAWRRAIATKALDHVEQCLDPLFRFHLMRGRLREGLDLLTEAVERLRKLNLQPRRRRLLTRLLISQGDLLERLGRYEEATTTLQQALSLARHAGEEHISARALQTLGQVAYRQGQYEEAERHLEASLSIVGAPLAAPPPARRVRAAALTSLGLLCHQTGDYEAAERALQESLEIRRQLGDPYGLAFSLNDLGIVAGTVGAYAEAKKYFEECLVIRRRLEDRWGVAVVLNNLGLLAHYQGDYDQAEACFQESLAIRQEIGNRWAVAIVLNNLGQVALARDNLADAEAYYRQGLAIRHQIDDAWGIAASLNSLGELSLTRGEYEQARTHFLEALRRSTTLEALPLALETLAGLAELYNACGESQQALELCALVLNHPASDEETKKKVRHLLDGSPLEERQVPNLDKLIADLLQNK